jgi:TPR repeat protein
MTALDTLSRDDIAARLAASPAERARLVREAAEAGSAEAQAVLGQMLLDGHGVARDERAALGWFAKAAAQHHVMALNMVGRCYDLGWGTAVDKGRAAECYRVAAARGLPEAMYNFATLLALGEGVAEDKVAALGWLEKAAALGFAKAANFVGSFAEDGWAGPRDMAKAAGCYARAAEGDDFRGCFNHARMLAEAGDLDAAVHWIGRAAALGHDRFRGQVREWLARAPEPLRSRGLAAC